MIRGEKILYVTARRQDEPLLLQQMIFAVMLAACFWLFFVIGAFYF